MYAPLQQRRGAPLKFEDPNVLPPLGNDGGSEEKDMGRNIFGDPFSKKSNDVPFEAKPLPKPGPKQTAAAERLMKGYVPLWPFCPKLFDGWC